MTSIERGQVYYVYLDPAFGHEIGGYKMRPVVVLSINYINNRPLVVSVVPGTSASPKAEEFRNVVLVKKSHENQLKWDTDFHCEQIRAIDRGRFVRRSKGSVSQADLKRFDIAMKYCFGLV